MIRLVLAIILVLLSLVAFTRAEEVFDVCAWAREVTIKDIGDKKWNKFVDDLQTHIDEESANNPILNKQVYVDFHITNAKPDLSKLDKIKEFVRWIALYQEWNLTLPTRVITALNLYNTDIQEVSKDFTWTKLMNKIAEVKKREGVK